MPRVGKSMDRARMLRRMQLSGAHSAESWNAAHPVGTAVRYWPCYPPIASMPPVDTTTRTPAWTLGDGSVVVSVVGKSGGVCLSHVEVLPRDERASAEEGDVKRDAHWYCKFCGDTEPAEEPYKVGDKEPCTTCGEGTAHVMTLADGARFASEVARGVRKPERSYTP